MDRHQCCLHKPFKSIASFRNSSQEKPGGLSFQGNFGLTAFGRGEGLGFWFFFALSFDYDILLSISTGIKGLAAAGRPTEPGLKAAKLESQGPEEQSWLGNARGDKNEPS